MSSAAPIDDFDPWEQEIPFADLELIVACSPALREALVAREATRIRQLSFGETDDEGRPKEEQPLFRKALADLVLEEIRKAVSEKSQLDLYIELRETFDGSVGIAARLFATAGALVGLIAGGAGFVATDFVRNYDSDYRPSLIQLAQDIEEIARCVAIERDGGSAKVESASLDFDYASVLRCALELAEDEAQLTEPEKRNAEEAARAMERGREAGRKAAGARSRHRATEGYVPKPRG